LHLAGERKGQAGGGLGRWTQGQGGEQARDRGIGDANYFNDYYADRDWKWYRHILALAIQYSEPGAILDVGAGVGYLVECAMRWNLTCLGLEGSAAAVASAQARCPSINLRQHALSEPFPFTDASVGSVFMNQVIEHLEPEVATGCLEECWRVLCPGGMLFVFSPSCYNVEEANADATHIHMYSPTELRQLLAAKGFGDVRSFDSPLPLLGRSTLATRVMYFVFKLTRWERLSASANCIAFKGAR